MEVRGKFGGGGVSWVVAWGLSWGLASAALGQWVTPQVSAPRVEYRTFVSQAAGTAVSFHVYTPPAYDAEASARFPVLYWLHGSGSATSGIATVSNWFGEAMARGDVPPMLVVFANGIANSMYCDAADGTRPVETVIMEELIPHVDATFRTIPTRRGRIVEGFSMGGYGAGRFGFKYSERFAAASMLGAGPVQLDFMNPPPGTNVSPAVRAAIYEDVWNSDPALYFAASPWNLATVHAGAIVANGVLVRMAVGESDAMLGPNEDLHEHLTTLGIAHGWETHTGVGHEPLALMQAMGTENWEFYRAALAPRCGSVDFNGDGSSFDPQDIDAFLSVFSEGPCVPEDAACGDVDFNNDGSLFDPCDIDSFLLVFSEGPCTLCGV